MKTLSQESIHAIWINSCCFKLGFAEVWNTCIQNGGSSRCEVMQLYLILCSKTQRCETPRDYGTHSLQWNWKLKCLSMHVDTFLSFYFCRISGSDCNDRIESNAYRPVSRKICWSAFNRRSAIANIWSQAG